MTSFGLLRLVVLTTSFRSEIEMTKIEYQVWASTSKDDWGHVVNAFDSLERAKEAAKQVKASYKAAGTRNVTIRIIQAKTAYFELAV